MDSELSDRVQKQRLPREFVTGIFNAVEYVLAIGSVMYIFQGRTHDNPEVARAMIAEDAVYCLEQEQQAVRAVFTDAPSPNLYTLRGPQTGYTCPQILARKK